MAIGLAQSATYNLNIRQDQSAKRTVREIGLVDLLEWTYADQRVYQDDAVMDDRRYLRGGSSMAGLLRIDELGTHVDGGGSSCAEPHLDALRVHECVIKLAELGGAGAVAAGLIVEYARSRRRPEKIELIGSHVEPRRDGRGRIVMSYRNWQTQEVCQKQTGSMIRSSEGKTCRKGQACELIFNQDAEIELYLAEAFDLWTAGLELIHKDLPSLSLWIVKPFERPAFIRHAKGPLELIVGY